jgi:class 3 adenylate cyclase/predicted ATPase
MRTPMSSVAEWLATLGLSEYTDRFAENDIDISVLHLLTDHDLKEIGVSLGHRRKMVAAIAELEGAAARATAQSAATPEPKRQDEAERRQLSVMFCDLVGSTSLSTQLDPEDLRAVIGSYHRCCTELIEQKGGFVAKYMGDGVLAYFGYPHAHEHDAERAVQAGLTLVETVPKLDTTADVPLQVRIGIATGLVVVGDLIGKGAAQEQAVVGETPNLAARLQALAEPGTVVISSTTRRLTGGLFDYRDLGTVALKGFGEKVPAWQVLCAGAAESRFEALRATGTPLVGRAEEIELLMRRWEQAKAGDGCVVLLFGEPGVGKSRIAQTIVERLVGEPHTRLRYFCSPHHQDSPLYPSIAQLTRAAGFRRDDTDEQRLAKLEAVLARATDDPGDTVQLLADLLRIPTGDRYPPLNLTPQKRREKTIRAQLAQVEGLAGRQPVLMLFEDVHWSDPTTRESLDMLINRIPGLRVLLIITFRPEFTSPWVGRSQVTLLSLSRLPPRECAEMIANLTGGTTLPEGIADQIVDRTDGVPLFIEELTKAVVESGELADAGDRYTVTRSPSPLAIPSTLHASLLARLDRLATAREVAQIGAALGRHFSHELISAVAPMPQKQLDDGLAQLVSAELVFRRGAPPDAEYIFKHALVRDAAYGTLLRGARQHLHALIACALEERFPETAETQPELVAHHFTEAGRAERALPWWRRAGERARERSANLEAVRHLSKALDLLGSLPETPSRFEEELVLRMAIAAPLIATKGYAAPEVEATYHVARDLCHRLDRPSDLFPALRGLWNCYNVRGELPRAYDFARQLADLADAEEEQPLRRALSRRALGSSLLCLGDLLAALRYLEDGIRFSDAVGEARNGASGVAFYGEHPGIVCRLYLGWVLWFLGFSDRGLAQTEQGLAMARPQAHAHMLAFALDRRSVVQLLRREHGAALRYAEETIAVATESGLPQWRATGLMCRGFARAGLGQTAEGIADLRTGLAAYHETGGNIGDSWWLGFLAAAHAKAGQIEEALVALDAAMTRVTSAAEHIYEAELHRLRGELLLAVGDQTAAEGSFQAALAVARRQSAELLRLRASTSLARLWRDQAKRTEARDLLAPIYGWFTEGFDTPDLKEAKALLDELAS